MNCPSDKRPCPLGDVDCEAESTRWKTYKESHEPNPCSDFFLAYNNMWDNAQMTSTINGQWT